MTGRSNINGIGERLRAMFDSVASGPMPDHLIALVDQLEEAWRADQPAERQAIAATEVL